MRRELTYLYQLRRRNKGLFYVIVAYMLISLVSVASKNEMTPFYTWAMYSRPSAPADSVSTYLLEYNDGHIYNAPHTWKDHKRMMFYYTIAHYEEMRANRGREPGYDNLQRMAAKLKLSGLPLDKMYSTEKDMLAYPGWLKRYMQGNMQERIDSIKVYRNVVRFAKGGKVEQVSKELIFQE